jgi:hypothetical protein
MDSTSDFMNNYSSYHIIIFISLLLSFLFPQKTVNAQNQNFVEIPLESFHDEKPVELLGLISSQSLNIPIPEGWSIGEENWMEIDINSSPLLDLSRSSLTISLNGFQITSYTPTNIPETKQIIPIPGNMFSQGNNILTFTGALYLPHDRDTNCQNWDDPSRWLTIEPGGILHLSFVKRDLLFDLSKFPQTFIEPLENYIPDKKATLIVMPGRSDSWTSTVS